MTRAASYTVWALLALALVAGQLAAMSRRAPVDTFGQFLGRLTARPSLRTLLVLGWMWTGWHFFAR